MPTPLDVFLGEPLAPERQAAIDAVRAAGGEENSMTFWDHAQKVQRICARTEHEPGAVAKALSLIEPYVSPDGEYSRMAIFDSDLDGLTCMVARLVGCPAVTPEERATRIASIGGERDGEDVCRGYDPTGEWRTVANCETAKLAREACNEETAESIARGTDKGPLSEWKFRTRRLRQPKPSSKIGRA